jgi:hypothetical protein
MSFTGASAVHRLHMLNGTEPAPPPSGMQGRCRRWPRCRSSGVTGIAPQNRYQCLRGAVGSIPVPGSLPIIVIGVIEADVGHQTCASRICSTPACGRRCCPMASMSVTGSAQHISCIRTMMSRSRRFLHTACRRRCCRWPRCRAVDMPASLFVDGLDVDHRYRAAHQLPMQNGKEIQRLSPPGMEAKQIPVDATLSDRLPGSHHPLGQQYQVPLGRCRSPSSASSRPVTGGLRSASEADPGRCHPG